MKKIKLLRNLAILYGIANLAHAIYTISSFYGFNKTAANSKHHSFVIKYAVEHLFILPALVLIITTLTTFMKQGTFNRHGAKLLQYTGFLIILQAMVAPVTHYFLPFGDGAIFIIYSLYASVLPLCFGIGLLVIADFIKKAHALKEENQLTI